MNAPSSKQPDTYDSAYFTRLYASGGWDGCGSGPGSTPAFTSGYRAYLDRFLLDHRPSSVLDLACGDWQSSKLIDWHGATYTGIDIVEPLITTNRRRYGNSTTRFLHADIFDASWPWPSTDLLLVKDLLHHIDQPRVCWLIERATSAGYKWILWTVDLNPDGTVANVPASCHNYFTLLPIVYEFDTSIERYRYGPKVTLLDAASASS